jgi:site-specific recombinase XerD
MTGISYNLARLTESYAHCLASEGKSPKTIEWYTANLKRFTKFLDDSHFSDIVTEVGKAEARQFISYLQTDVRRWENHPNIRDDRRLSAYSITYCGVLPLIKPLFEVRELLHYVN